jgi:hypothetical protein
MLKKLMLSGVLFISVMMLLPTQASAWDLYGGGFGWGTYEGTFGLKGGGPDKDDNFAIFEGSYVPLQVYLWQFNPKGNDVRVGIGGLKAITQTTKDESFRVIGNGNFEVGQLLLSRTPEFAQAICQEDYLKGAYSDLYKKYHPVDGDPPADPSALCEADPSPYAFCTDDPTNPLCAIAVHEFMEFWGLTDKDLRNKNWTAYEVLIKEVAFTGKVKSKCELQSDDTIICEKEDDVEDLLCTTDEDVRTWPGVDEKVEFFCEDLPE